jgi:hypothetical protein
LLFIKKKKKKERKKKKKREREREKKGKKMELEKKMKKEKFSFEKNRSIVRDHFVFYFALELWAFQNLRIANDIYIKTCKVNLTQIVTGVFRLMTKTS